MPLIFRPLCLVLLFALVACSSVPYARDGRLPTPVTPSDASSERAALNLRVHDAVARHVTRLFYRSDAIDTAFATAVQKSRSAARDAPDETALYAVLDALLSRLDDDHTYAIGPNDRARVEARRNGRDDAGYGMLLNRVGESYVVALVRPGTPAADAGIMPGWELLEIDGHPVRISAAPLAGRTASLRFRDEHGDVRMVSLIAVVLPQWPRVEHRVLDDGSVYLRFDDFDVTRLTWMFEQIGALATAPPAVVLDLRRNGGGSIDAAALVNALFFPEVQAFAVLKGRFINRRMVARQPVHYAGPLRVLVGPASASASELLAARLQETARATIIGQRTRGAVVGTRGIDLPDGGLLYVGQFVMSTADGRALEGVGVMPDIVIGTDWQAVRDGHDRVVEAAQALR